MPRTARLLIPNEPAVYHVMSRTALGGYPLEDSDEDIKKRYALLHGKDTICLDGQVP